MRKVYLIPNMITAFALACGLFAIFRANMVEGEERILGVLTVGAVLLLIAAFADLLDGAVARVINAESEFGMIFDSLADAVSFGVAPSVLLLKALSLEAGSWLSFYAVLGCMLYSLCGVLRLVRYSTKKATSEKKQNPSQIGEQNKNFTGLPIPGAALAAVSVNLFLATPLAHSLWGLSECTQAILLPSIMIILGYLMVSRWRFPSAKALHVRLPFFELVLLCVIGASFVIYGLFYFFPGMLLILSWSYLLIACVLSVVRMIAGRKSKTLEDYEPDHEDEN